MPNGIVAGSIEEWDRLEAPLKALDAQLADFARRHSCTTRSNYHSWPRREFTWEELDGVTRWIDLRLENESDLLYLIEGKASEGGERALGRGYYHRKSIQFASRMPPPLDPQRVLEILEDAYRELNRLRVGDLERIEAKGEPAPNLLTLMGLAVKGYWDALGDHWRRRGS